MGKIYTSNYISSTPFDNRGEICCGKKEEEIEEKFIKRISEVICDILDININDRRMFISLLNNELSEFINCDQNQSRQYPGLLQQYLANKLDILGKKIKDSLLIPKEIEINHNYDNKFSSIIEYIQENFVRKDDINSDGTFETIINSYNKNMPKELNPCCESECCDKEPRDEELRCESECCDKEPRDEELRCESECCDKE